MLSMLLQIKLTDSPFAAFHEALDTFGAGSEEVAREKRKLEGNPEHLDMAERAEAQWMLTRGHWFEVRCTTMIQDALHCPPPGAIAKSSRLDPDGTFIRELVIPAPENGTERPEEFIGMKEFRSGGQSKFVFTSEVLTADMRRTALETVEVDQFGTVTGRTFPKDEILPPQLQKTRDEYVNTLYEAIEPWRRSI